MISRADLGFLRVAVATPLLVLADPAANAAATVALLDEAAAQGAALAVFPELGLTGYSCADLFATDPIRDAALAALGEVAAATDRTGVAAVVGLPLEVDGRRYNVAAVCAGGQVVGIVPKVFLATRAEFYEARWFATGLGAAPTSVRFGGQDVPFGIDLLFEASGVPGAVLGVEICEDLWAPEPPSGALAVAGATIIANPSASDELVGKADYRRALVAAASGRLLAAYLYAAAGPGESSTDLVYGGHSLIAEHGALLAEAERFRFEPTMLTADIDLHRLDHERAASGTFAASPARAHRRVQLPLPRAAAPATADLRHPLTATPFLAPAGSAREVACAEIAQIAATGLARRLRAVGEGTRLLIGLSGGLDSTLALLLAVDACRRAGRARDAIVAVTMPGPGTSQRTLGNARALAAALGVGLREIPITAAVEAHLADIGHGGAHDVAFENAQARERTQVLFDLANSLGGFVVGTGDLSEAAVGWMTYGGDHLSQYHVNAGIPKTLVRAVVEHLAVASGDPTLQAVLADIVATPISPELLPPASDGAAPGQHSEASVGPYELVDFFLFHLVRLGESPERVAYLGGLAFAGAHDGATLRRWMRDFVIRFTRNQFKRSAMPDGPKVGTVALSPRGDWRMPSDASAAAWLAAIDDLDAADHRAPA